MPEPTMSPACRTALDLTETLSREPSGCAVFTARLAEAMARVSPPADFPVELTGWYRHSHRAKKDWCPVSAMKPLRELSRLPLPGAGADIIHGFGTHAPRLGAAARVVTLFDVFSALPSSEKWQLPRSRKRKMGQYRTLARSCCMVLAISETTRNDFIEYFGYPEESIRVVYGGVEPQYRPEAVRDRDAVLEKYGLPGHYLFYIGAPVPRKNVDGLIRGYARSKTSKHAALVVAGGKARTTDDLKQLAESLGVGSKVFFTGYVPDEDKPALYASAQAFVFPSFYEGLGLPLLEALACGTPVLAGREGAAAEITDRHGVSVDPENDEAIAEGIDAVVDPEEKRLKESSKWAQSLTWEASARQTLEAYRWLMNKKGAAV